MNEGTKKEEEIYFTKIWTCQSIPVPSITVSLYVGDIDEPKNGRRKRATGDDECMRLEDVRVSFNFVFLYVML